MKLSFILLIALLVNYNKLKAQTLSPAVISSSGGFTSNGTGMLSATVGEMTMVETFINPNIILTQGFQQPEDFNVSVKDIAFNKIKIQLGPNPTNGLVNLFFEETESMRVHIELHDMLGKVLYRGAVEKQDGHNFVQMNFSTMSCGDYFLDCYITSATSKTPVKFSTRLSIVD